MSDFCHFFDLKHDFTREFLTLSGERVKLFLETRNE